MDYINIIKNDLTKQAEILSEKLDSIILKKDENALKFMSAYVYFMKNYYEFLYN